jgi:hypothetical protein
MATRAAAMLLLVFSAQSALIYFRYRTDHPPDCGPRFAFVNA